MPATSASTPTAAAPDHVPAGPTGGPGRCPPQGRRRDRAVPLVLGLLLVAGLVVRVPMLAQRSGDYRALLLPWYSHLVDAGGFAGLADSFSSSDTLPRAARRPDGPAGGPAGRHQGDPIVFDVLLSLELATVLALAAALVAAAVLVLRVGDRQSRAA